jgi:hypothetical protein
MGEPGSTASSTKSIRRSSASRGTAAISPISPILVLMSPMFGDARLTLKQATDHQYGLIVMDAFTSDAIPHLLTRGRRAMQKLADNGLLVFHVSHRYLDLQPVLGDPPTTQDSSVGS